MFCQKCGTEIANESQRFCHNCGAAVGNAAGYANQQNGRGWNSRNQDRGFTSKINKLAGGKGQVDLHLRDLVSGVFKHHNAEETEQLFICGTSKTTPKEADIISEWPKPWLYSRVLILLLAVYFALTIMWKQMGNRYALMNIPYIGTLIAPMTVLVFFFEMNVPRNISIIRTFKVFVAGGVASLFLTLTLFSIAPEHDITTIEGAIVIGVVEELGKLLICAYFISKHKGKLYLLNGILYGGAVGAGFAVFESVGYALKFGINNGMMQTINASGLENIFSSMQSDGLAPFLNSFYQHFYSEMLGIMKMRGFLSPGGHIAWAAVEGFAMILAMKEIEFTWETLTKPAFLKIVWIPIVLHALWDSPLFGQTNLMRDCKYAFCVGLIWLILLVFISRGLQQISEIKERAKGE